MKGTELKIFKQIYRHILKLKVEPENHGTEVFKNGGIIKLLKYLETMFDKLDITLANKKMENDSVSSINVSPLFPLIFCCLVFPILRFLKLN